MTRGEKWGYGAYKINRYAEKGRMYAGIYINMQIAGSDVV